MITIEGARYYLKRRDSGAKVTVSTDGRKRAKLDFLAGQFSKSSPCLPAEGSPGKRHIVAKCAQFFVAVDPQKWRILLFNTFSLTMSPKYLPIQEEFTILIF